MNPDESIAGVADAPYTWETLPNNPPTIRVVTITPASSYDAPVELTVRQIPLADDHTCLSYMCGNADAREVIFINSKRTYVRPNLYSFLRLARRLNVTDPLWIDALCIDQNNVPERNEQVQLMGDIYETATQVLIYPGPLPKGLRELSSWRKRPPGVSLQDIEAMPYWRRTWIVQEILLAQKAFLVADDGLIDWYAFNRRFSGNSHIGRLATYNYKKMKKQYPNQASLLGQFADTECTDVRDHVYAMRALVVEYADVAVDYGEDEAAMLVRVAIECALRRLEHVDHDGGLWMLGDHLHGLGQALGVSIEIICGACFQALAEEDQARLCDIENHGIAGLTWEYLLVKTSKSAEPTIIGRIGAHFYDCGHCRKRRTGTKVEFVARGHYSAWIKVPKYVRYNEEVKALGGLFQRSKARLGI